ncbi:hypothetical protein BUALT_Bualt10G0062500 [Buddleja alternifolia]|uniref:Myb/SANT-like domain-containing protein n=1 Tax=Buddleja alternifolia TaxID=168488 RepID=A0AAV6X7E8_9LAMI|nr:hypothetical protein BUALT_Bualt10G0062500 [Buddleja alternifolia]
MIEVIVRGYKCDNGFRTGYQGILEQAMLQACPGSNIRAEPHISSSLTVWKKNHGSLSQMLSRSGFGWNDSSHALNIQSEDTDNDARTMRHKSWPLYKDWCEIFGKDRATGENGEAFAEELNNADLAQSMSECCGGSSASQKSKSSRKRKTTDDDYDSFMPTLAAFCDKFDARLADISKRIGFEHGALKSRKTIFEALGSITWLDMEQKIYVSNILVENTKNMDLFFSLPNDAGAAMVRMMLEGRLTI